MAAEVMDGDLYYRKRDISDEPGPRNCVTVWVEVGADGWRRREVGFDPSGLVVHRFPDLDYPEGRYGIFDSYPMERNYGEAISAAEFETAWEADATAPERWSLPAAWRRIVAKLRRRARGSP